MQKPIAEKGTNCPIHKQDMSKVCHKCAWWTLLRGKHPQTFAEIDEWGCAVAWLPVLMIENAQQSRQTGAAVESFRNEVVKTNGLALSVLGEFNRPQVPPPMRDVQAQILPPEKAE